MPANPPSRKVNRPLGKDRRAPPGARASTEPLRRLKGVLNRPIGLERRDGHLHVVLSERRQPPPADASLPLAQLCDELSARLLAHGPDDAAQAMRHLVLLHDVLEREGWPGVAALPSPVLGEALAQAEILASDEPSVAMDTLIEGLTPLQTAAVLRDESDSRLQDFGVGENLEVSESDFAEFDDLERGWAGTTPDRLARSERDDD